MNEQQFWNELPQVIKVLTDSRANEFKNNSEGLEKWHAKHSRNGVWASTLFNDCDTKKRSTRKNHYDKELKTISFDTLPSSYKNACYFYKEKCLAFYSKNRVVHSCASALDFHQIPSFVTNKIYENIS